MENTSNPSRGWQRVATEVALVGLLVLLIGKVTYDIASVLDLTSWDEPGYMMMGEAIPERGLPAADFGPLYCLWYRALSLLQPDHVRLFYLSWQLLIGLLVVGIYLLCRAAGATRALAVLTSFLALNSRLLDVWPFSGILATVVMVWGTAAAACCRRWAWSLAVLGATLLLASFVRPECAASFGLFCAAALVAGAWAVFRRPRSWRGLLAPTLTILLLTAAALRCLGNPLGGGRSFVAFGQHYAYNVVTARNLPIEPMVHFLEICRKDFGDAQTLGEAFRVNPHAIVWHFRFNLRRLPAALGSLGEPVLALSVKGQRWLCWVLGALLVLGLAGQVRRLARRGEAAASDSGQHGLLVGLTMLGFVLPPTLVSCVVVYPWARYLMCSGVLLFALLAAGLAHLPRGRTLWARLETPAALVLLAGLLGALALNRAHGWCLQQRRIPGSFGPPPLRRLVQTVRGLPLRGTVTFLDYGGPGTAFFAGLPPRLALVGNKQGIGFREYLQRFDVGAIVLSPWLLNDVNFRDDPEFKEFASGGWTDRFRYLPVQGTYYQLAVRKDLLAPR